MARRRRPTETLGVVDLDPGAVVARVRRDCVDYRAHVMLGRSPDTPLGAALAVSAPFEAVADRLERLAAADPDAVAVAAQHITEDRR